MSSQNKQDIPITLYHEVMGQMMLDYVEHIHPTVIEKAMENRAIRTLEAIRRILEDDSYNDPECFERVDALVMLFFKELGININRHSELD